MDNTKEKQRSRGEKMLDFLRGRGSNEAAESDTAKREKDALRGREKQMRDLGLACGGKVKKYAKGGSVRGYGAARGANKACKTY